MNFSMKRPYGVSRATCVYSLNNFLKKEDLLSHPFEIKDIKTLLSTGLLHVKLRLGLPDSGSYIVKRFLFFSLRHQVYVHMLV